MEKFGLVDKTKDELIDIVLNQEAKRKQMNEEYDKTNAKLAHAISEVKKRDNSICILCVIIIMMMVSVVVLSFS